VTISNKNQLIYKTYKLMQVAVHTSLLLFWAIALLAKTLYHANAETVSLAKMGLLDS
jgi:hypothetical protein